MRFCLVSAALLSSACTNEVISGPGGCLNQVGGTGGGSGFEEVLLEGHSATLTLELNIIGCSSMRDATSVDVEVDGPDNLPVAHTQGPVASGSFQHSIPVTFTPDRPGPYHLRATFQPNLGIAQRDVRAARDFTQVPVALTVPRTCEQLAVTQHRAVLCSDFSAVHVFRDAVEVQTLTAEALAVNGDGVWVANGFSALRYVDTGTGPLQPAAAPSTVTLIAGARVLLGDADTLWVISDDDARRYQRDVTGYVSRERWTFPRWLGSVYAAYGADGLLVATDTAFCSTLGADAGTLACDTVRFNDIYGAGADGLWTGESASLVELREPGHSSVRASLATPVGWVWARATAQGDQPYIGGQPYSLSWLDSVPVLAKWGAVPTRAIEGWAVFSDGATTTLRPAP